MKLLYINRAIPASAQPGQWHQIVPLGEYPVHQGDEQIIQVIDAPAIQAMAAAAKNRKILIDYDHESYDPAKRTTAAGWITNTEARPDGLYGLIEWSGSGQAAVEGKDYRYLSPTFLRDDTTPLAANRLRPLRLDTVALTNCPNMRDIQPLSNAAPAAQLKPKSHHKMDYKAKLIALLGLSPEASDADLEAAITAHTPGEQADTAALENRIADLEEQLTNRDLDAAGITDKDERATWAALLNADRENGLKALKNRQPADTKGTPRQPITNRYPPKAPAKAPEGDGETKAKAEATRASAIRNRAHAIQQAEGVSWAVAFNRASSEQPATEQ
jgi:phage I-like protein